ncbi:MAG TPA: hypothetical protein VMW72_25785 [Sedimentisphaerales bacterium]|nr:hypothetical protein [Sedimentisphaerales bacterium]
MSPSNQPVGRSTTRGEGDGHADDIIWILNLTGKPLNLPVHVASEQTWLAECFQCCETPIALDYNKLIVLPDRQERLVREIVTRGDALRHIQCLVMLKEVLYDLTRCSCRCLTTKTRILRIQMKAGDKKLLCRPFVGWHRCSFPSNNDYTLCIKRQAQAVSFCIRSCRVFSLHILSSFTRELKVAGTFFFSKTKLPA